MNRILLVEDSSEMASLVRDSLNAIAKVDIVCLRKDVEACLHKHDYNLFILDLNLPDSHGYEIYNLIRANERWANCPVIFLTGDATDTSQITSFNMGVDDYIVKPIKMSVFRARILSKLKISKTESNIIRIGPVIIDPLGLRAALVVDEQVDGSIKITEKEMDLTPIEFKILVSLLKHKDRVVSRVLLNEEVWGKKVYVGDRVVDQHVSSLRKKLAPHQSLIHTIYGTGYRFLVDSEVRSTNDQTM
jgi:two-component system phosphate regulon response regulator PhoB